jgi:hypothetical protein
VQFLPARNKPLDLRPPARDSGSTARLNGRTVRGHHETVEDIYGDAVKAELVDPGARMSVLAHRLRVTANYALYFSWFFAIELSALVVFFKHFASLGLGSHVGRVVIDHVSLASAGLEIIGQLPGRGRGPPLQRGLVVVVGRNAAESCRDP